MDDGENVREWTIATPHPPVGGYKIGPNFMIMLTERPHWLHRFMVRWVFGWRWEDE